MKKTLLFILVLLCYATSFAQQDAMYTHYMYNTLGINPAYAGSRNALTVTALHRSQWVGFEGAPKTQTLTLHTPVFNDKIGAGLSIINDQIGYSSNIAVAGDLTYRMKINETDKLSFGLKMGVNSFNSKFSAVNTEDGSDSAFEADVVSKIVPNVGIGLYYSSPKYYVGVSVPKLIENKLSNSLSSENRHYYMIAGALVDLSKMLKVKPSVLVKTTAGAPLGAALTATVIYNEKFNLGAMYRLGDAMGVLLGIDVDEHIHFGYSIDWSSGQFWSDNINTLQRTSHEIMLRYDFIYKKQGNVYSPRYF